MIIESGNLSYRATSKLIITKKYLFLISKLRNEILSLKQNYSDYLGQLVEDLIYVLPTVKPSFFLHRINLLLNEEYISISDRLKYLFKNKLFENFMEQKNPSKFNNYPYN